MAANADPPGNPAHPYARAMEIGATDDAACEVHAGRIARSLHHALGLCAPLWTEYWTARLN